MIDDYEVKNTTILNTFIVTQVGIIGLQYIDSQHMRA